MEMEIAMSVIFERGRTAFDAVGFYVGTGAHSGPQGLKPREFVKWEGTAEAVPPGTRR